MKNDSTISRNFVDALDGMFSDGIRRARFDIYLNRNPDTGAMGEAWARVKGLDESTNDLVADAAEVDPSLFTMADLYREKAHVLRVITAEEWVEDAKLRASIKKIEESLAL